MTKLKQYLQSGTGHGLRIVFWTALLLSIVSGFLVFRAGKQLSELPPVTQFIDSFPSFSIKDGAIQNQDLKWSAFLPFTSYPVVIDTTQENLSVPTPDGLYITRKALYHVADYGVQLNRSEFDGDVEVSPTYLHSVLHQFILSFSVGLAIFSFVVSWLGFLLSVGLSALIGLICGLVSGKGRVWRVAAVTWFLGQLTAVALSFVNITASWWLFALIIVVNVLILTQLKKA